MNMFSRARANKIKGDLLEKRVERLFKRLWKLNVKRDVTVTDKFGNKSQIDVMYGLFFKTFIECKNYTGHLVPLEDVAKFKEVLHLNDIPLNRGIFVTTSGYVPRALTIGIRTIDGNQLRALEKQSMVTSFLKWLLLGTAIGGFTLYYFNIIDSKRFSNINLENKLKEYFNDQQWKTQAKTWWKRLSAYIKERFS